MFHPVVRWVTVTCLALAAATVSAHHSSTEYDKELSVPVSGVLKEVYFENPHVRLVLDVTDEKGATVEWKMEGQPPGWYRRAGIRRADFEKGLGAKVTVHVHPGKDHKPIGFFEKVTFADGTYIHFGT